MIYRITKSDLRYVIGECKRAIEKAQPDVHSYAHEHVRGDEKRTLELAYFLLDQAEESVGYDKVLAESRINQAIGLIRAWDIDPTETFDERILAMPHSVNPS